METKASALLMVYLASLREVPLQRTKIREKTYKTQGRRRSKQQIAIYCIRSTNSFQYKINLIKRERYQGKRLLSLSYFNSHVSDKINFSVFLLFFPSVPIISSSYCKSLCCGVCGHQWNVKGKYRESDFRLLIMAGQFSCGFATGCGETSSSATKQSLYLHKFDWISITSNFHFSSSFFSFHLC